MAIYFRLLTEDAYVQTGAYSFSETYNTVGGSSFIYNAITPSDVSMPSTFAREWATVTNADYDWGAYGIGLQRSSATVTLPTVEQRTLLYMYDVRGTSERRTLVESTLSSSDLQVAGVLSAGGGTALYTQEEYYAQFGQAGRTDFGGSGELILPSGISTTSVNELYSYNGVISGVNSGNPIQIYVSATFLGNERPLFDEVYLLSDQVVAATDSDYVINDYQVVSRRQVRWLGGVPSETTAFINFADASDSAIDRSNNSYAYTSTVVDEGITEDGVSYTNTDAYNVTNLKRF